METRGGDRDVPVALIYYYGMGTYWLWMYNPQRRQPSGEFTTWGKIVYHFINPWLPTVLPKSENANLQTQCRTTMTSLEKERKYRSAASLDLVARDEVDFLRTDVQAFRTAVCRAHDSEAEAHIRDRLSPIVKGTDAESRYLFWRNEYYSEPPELSMIWNIRRYPPPVITS